MSYEPTNWKSGDVVTSAKLNKLEQGLATNILLVQAIADDDSPTTFHLDKTWQEIHDAPFAIIKYIDDNSDIMTSIYIVVATGIIDDEHYVIAAMGYTNINPFANSPDEYPTFTKS